MEKNTLKNNIQDPERTLDFEVLEEIPEVSPVNRSDKIQLILFPLIALIIIAAAPVILSFTVMRPDKAPINRDFPFDSIESPLLRSAMNEVNTKRREIDLRDIRIRQYQNRVLEMDDKLRLLQGLMEETLQIKETNLLEEIDSIVFEERTRLENMGRSDEQISQALTRLKTSLDTKYNNEMEDFRSQELQAYKQRLSGLQEEKAALEEALNTAVTERQTLAENLKTDEKELLEGLYDDEDFTRIVNAGIDNDLEILRETKNVENYWLDELANQYLGLIDAITARDFGKAENYLSALEHLFSDDTIAQLPGIKARNEADRKLLRFFSAYLSSMEENDLQEFIADSKLLVDLALSHMEAGRYQEADIAWRKLNANWPLMDQATRGYLKTYSELIAIEVNRYAQLSGAALADGKYQSAAASWSSCLAQVPGPVGGVLKNFWQIWENNYNSRLAEKDQTTLTALALEKEEASARYDSLYREFHSAERENQHLRNQLNEVLQQAAEAENEALTAIETDNSRWKTEISTLENRVRDLESRLAESEEALLNAQNEDDTLEESSKADTAAAAAVEEKISPRWQVYGFISSVSGETYTVKPLINRIPLNGVEVRVMQSLSKDRIIHIADGYILSANTYGASIRLSSIFSTPEIDDLVYIVITAGEPERTLHTP